MYVCIYIYHICIYITSLSLYIYTPHVYIYIYNIDIGIQALWYISISSWIVVIGVYPLVSSNAAGAILEAD